MRLTKLKLAGFKSFVDPTNVMLPGQLVAVVGPNGCGKSNIMDAVRWVLGESRATELRGESMQDVIFNGSGNRKPVGRASVELVFENTQGRLAGQWSVYPEIAVRRVLDREGNSSYLINNLQVRRKDVIDLFLGTGLGPRAYAIIGQGMISRIIEARPEDLRLFLEEAAGVSKYKERRKETQHRLEDARENLLRVEDICTELDSRILNLEAQAEVARRYRDFQENLVRSQNLLWYSRRNNARLERHKLAQEVERAINGLEEKTAHLRDIESRLETSRSAHFAASDALHGAQAELYAANAEVARLEGELNHQRESRRRIEIRLAQLAEEESRWQEQGARAEEDQAQWKDKSEAAALREESAEARHEELAGRMPDLELTWQTTEAQTQGVRRDVAQAEQQLKVEETHRQNARRALDTLAQRHQRLAQDGASLKVPDTQSLETLRESQQELQEQLRQTQEELGRLQTALPDRQSAAKAAQDRERTHQKALTEILARRDALESLQKKVQQDGRLGDWLKKHNLAQISPLWRSVRVEPGWEKALEAVLRERLAALALSEEQGRAVLADPVQANLAFALPVSLHAEGLPSAHEDHLLSRVQCDDSAWRPVLAGWLAGVRCCDDLMDRLPSRAELAPGEMWMNPQGQSLTRHGLGLYAPDAATHGVLERQEEIAQLGERLESGASELELARESLKEAESALADCQEHLSQARRDAQSLQQKLHGVQLEVVRLSESRQRYEEQQARIAADREELAESELLERDRLEQAELSAEEIGERLEVLRESLETALDRQRRADTILREVRAAEQAAARELQEARFAGRESATRLQDLARSRQLVTEQLGRVADDRSQAREELLLLEENALQQSLQAALEIRQQREQALALERNGVDGAAEALRLMDQERLKTEQELAPLRDRINDLRLKEQAALLNEEQYVERLKENGADEDQLAAWAAQPGVELRENRLNAEINRLTGAIADLGAVNLAALEELATARERKGFLDAQFADLHQAIDTLEDAIRRIDRETREQLQGTYDQVNRQFGILFPELFGGGEARLILTGDEILDAGIQVMAQPPGKKNSTIHLLSGGEKALTAIALVFSIFQLNPAPFCLLDEVDAPLDDTNTERFCEMVKRMSQQTQFLFISHNKITMEMASQLVGVTMQESGVSRVVEVDMEEALKLREDVPA